jgi:predicted MFS family arabinose efflux permease
MAAISGCFTQGSRLLRYDVVSDGEIFDEKRIDCADFAYGVATVIGSFFIGIHDDQGPATVVSILNVVVFKEEASFV